ncbi:glutathione S-transferase [Rhizobium wenxiniae]|uniref:Glutathione S-transferase n=1 Tax=Rhizobium wenxiniae TaxID=1737357 RepID=A0A7W9Y7Y3_9HYPH|nr:glutathione transferase GstA [Rhizobium wenxiniae]MBB6163654.1 glutathione S-transferase [Rhizobium wenxiniae]GGG12021.1 glutathione S-transferase [Rhizobium wenxiniae]
MKLFAHPGASSLSVHILLRETELPFELEIVNATEKVRAFGGDYRQINPRGMVPALELEDGTILTENLVIAQYLCDTAGRTDLMPAAGTKERYEVMEWQSFIATELHKATSPLFWPLDEGAKSFVRKRLFGKYRVVDDALQGGPFLTGNHFTAADAYLFPILSWALFFNLELSEFPNIRGFLHRMGKRPSVLNALKAEGKGLVTILREESEAQRFETGSPTDRALNDHGLEANLG